MHFTVVMGTQNTKEFRSKCFENENSTFRLKLVKYFRKISSGRSGDLLGE